MISAFYSSYDSVPLSHTESAAKKAWRSVSVSWGGEQPVKYEVLLLFLLVSGLPRPEVCKWIEESARPEAAECFCPYFPPNHEGTETW